MIELILLDIDGVLTDGRIYVDESGKETKKINFEDIDAIFELKRAGIKIGFITGEDNAFCDYVKVRFLPDYFIRGSKDKLGSYKTLVKKERLKDSCVCFVGDSQKDIPLLKHLSHSFAPSDVPSAVKNAASFVLKSARGSGVVKESAEAVFSINGDAMNKKSFVAGYMDTRLDEHVSVIQSIKKDVGLMKTIEKVAQILVKAFKNTRTLLICGNGGSAADAQHIAAKLVSRFFLERKALDAEALTVNVSSLTAIGNDYAYDVVFSRQVEAKGKKDDVLLAISTSGSSRNVIQAVEKAKALKMLTIGMTGNKKDTPLEKCTDVCIKVPSTCTPRIQEAHILIGHILCEFVEDVLFGKGRSKT